MRAKQSKATGWGRSLASLSTDSAPKSLEELQLAIATEKSSRGLLAYGLRRSYGDSSLNSGGLAINMAFLAGIEIDRERAIATVGGALPIRDLEKNALLHQLFPPVVPGTGYVTIGGAIAADIHGKSHHLTGSFSASLLRIQLLYADGNIEDIFPHGPTAPHFWATVGGLGLTGIILEADLQLIAMQKPVLMVEESRAKNLAALFTLLIAADKDFEHTVAWIDLSGDFRGRGIISKGNYLENSLPASISDQKATPLSQRVTPFPYKGKFSLINPKTVRVFNELWFRKPLGGGVTSLTTFMHPLDRVQGWNHIYGREGFLQYQFVISDGNEDFIESALHSMKSLGVASFLGVLKRFGAESAALLSFPKPGWALAIDIPMGLPNLEKVLNELDAELVSRGGRIYLVKDSRLRPEFLPLMYPRLEEWRSVRNEMDPHRLWQSDQSRRLKLC